MLALDFLRTPDASGPRPIYAAFGNDAYLKSAAVEAIARQALGEDADGGVSKFAGDKSTLADVLDEVRTLPFLASRRLAVVEDADGFVTKYRKGLEDYAEAPSRTGSLVLLPKAWPSTTKLAKKVESAGLSIDCKTPSERELAPWAASLAKGRGARLDEDAGRILVELIGPDPGLIASEVEKLATFVGDRRQIGRDDVVRMVGGGRVEKIWRVIDDATTGRVAPALDALDGLLASGEHPVGLLAQVAGSLRRVHHAGALRLARVGVREACREADIPPHAVEKTEKQHAHLGPTRTSRLPATLLKADLDLKGSSSLPGRVVLERLLVELARRRLD